MHQKIVNTKESKNLVFLSKKGNFKTLNRIVNNLSDTTRVLTRLFTPRNVTWIEQDDLIIRWGCVTTIQPQPENIINTRNAIIGASNKKTARENILKAELPAPEITTKVPCIARNLKHKKGRGLVFCTTQESVKNAIRAGKGYFQEFIDKDNEYRVHIAHGGVLAVQKKIHVEPEDEDNFKLSVIWNYNSGYIFEPMRWSEIPTGICPIAVQAIELFNLDFGAVDVIEKDGKFYILEINTAPRVEGYIALKYAQYIEWLYKQYIKNNEVPEHWEDRKRYIIRSHELDVEVSNLAKGCEE